MAGKYVGAVLNIEGYNPLTHLIVELIPFTDTVLIFVQVYVNVPLYTTNKLHCCMVFDVVLAFNILILKLVPRYDLNTVAELRSKLTT